MVIGLRYIGATPWKKACLPGISPALKLKQALPLVRPSLLVVYLMNARFGGGG
jgi:hypothetical protein